MADEDKEAGEQAPANGEPAPDNGELAPANGEPAPDNGEPAPDTGEPAPDNGESEDGKLLDTERGEPFTFKIPNKSQHYMQKRYEALGNVATSLSTFYQFAMQSKKTNPMMHDTVISDYVYELMENETKLKRVHVPVDAKGDEPTSFIFMSEDALTNPEKLLILIHGTGVVRAGQWSRRIILNDSLEEGTQLPYIKEALREGYGVMVLNTNLNSFTKENKVIYIRENSCAEDHGNYVWREFVSKARAKNIAIVAHSYGGIVTVDMGIENAEDFKKRVFAVAFTDSIHCLPQQKAPKDITEHFQKVGRNWISSVEPLDTHVSTFHPDLPKVSAGTESHPLTSHSAFKSVFRYISEKLQERKTLDNPKDSKSQ